MPSYGKPGGRQLLRPGWPCRDWGLDVTLPAVVTAGVPTHVLVSKEGPSAMGAARPSAAPQDALVCPVRVPGVPPFQVLVGQAEVTGDTIYGVDVISSCLANATRVPNLNMLQLMLGLSRAGELIADLG